MNRGLNLASSLRSLSVATVCSSCLFLAGCGASTPDPANSGPANPSASASPDAPLVDETGVVREVAADTLPIGDYMPPLDGGRVELAVPEGWSVPSRDSRYVVKMLKSSTSFPKLIVTSSADDWSGISELNADNVGDFAKAVAERLASAEKKIEVIEPVIPMVLGDRPVARYVRRTRFKGSSKTVTVERQILVTLGAGQVYEIDLQSPVGKIKVYRDAAYSVAASMKFKSAEPSSEAPKSEAPKSEAPKSGEDSAGADSG